MWSGNKLNWKIELNFSLPVSCYVHLYTAADSMLWSYFVVCMATKTTRVASFSDIAIASSPSSTVSYISYTGRWTVFGLSVRVSARAWSLSSTFVTVISYKPLAGMSPNLQHRYSWGQWWTDCTLNSKGQRSRSQQVLARPNALFRRRRTDRRFAV